MTEGILADTNPGLCRPPNRAGFALGRRASLAASVGVVAHTLWTSAAPALTYRLYAREWHLVAKPQSRQNICR
jgi:hypothetical protein